MVTETIVKTIPECGRCGGQMFPNYGRADDSRDIVFVCLQCGHDGLLIRHTHPEICIQIKAPVKAIAKAHWDKRMRLGKGEGDIISNYYNLLRVIMGVANRQ